MNARVAGSPIATPHLHASFEQIIELFVRCRGAVAGGGWRAFRRRRRIHVDIAVIAL
jgi:allantoicase